VRPAGDYLFFWRPVGQSLANFEGFARVTPAGIHEVASSHPPLYSFLLAGFDLVGLDSIRAHQFALAVLGSIALIALAEAARRLWNPRIALVAVGVAALDPLWVTHTAAVMSEALVLILVPIVLWFAVVCTQSPSTRRYLGMGFFSGLLVLTRTDTLALVGLMMLAVLFATRVPWRDLLRPTAMFTIALVAVLAPWSIRDKIQADTFNLSLNAGTTVAGSNCYETFNQPDLLGGFTLRCSFAGAARATREAGRPLGPAELDGAMTGIGYRYMADHRGRIPAVVSARFRRTWGLYPVDHQMLLAQQEGRSLVWERRGLNLWFVLLVPFLVGIAAAVARRDRRDLILAAPIIAVTFVSVTVYGSTRMRVAAQPSVAVLIAVGLMTVVGTIQRMLEKSSDSSAGEAGDVAGRAPVGAEGHGGVGQ